MKKHAFSRSWRLTERRQFVRLFDKPSVYKATSFQAFWKMNEAGVPRLGITIKGRLTSVWRMRIKRTIREWFRISKEKMGSNDLNVVIYAPQKLSLDHIDVLRKQLKEWQS